MDTQAGILAERQAMMAVRIEHENVPRRQPHSHSQLWEATALDTGVIHLKLIVNIEGSHV